ncbi:hypothetical protein HRbin36_02609 [bacterium HR36]|nr:hypothetical protein HRbin36_02609 [bacterium HR36]
MTPLGLLEWTSRYLRFWHTGSDGAWQPHIFQGQGPGLPLVIRYGRTQQADGRGSIAGWQIGWPAWKVYYARPLEVLADFFPQWHAASIWRIGSKKITAARLLSLVLSELSPATQQVQSWSLLLPSYWEEAQAQEFTDQLQRSGLQPMLALAQDLALAWAAWLNAGPFLNVVLADLDDYACTVSRVARQGDALVVAQRVCLRELGRRVWVKRLLAACAEMAIHSYRLDPRLSQYATQLLLLHLEQSLAQLGQVGLRLRVHVPDFHGELVLSAALIHQACTALAQAVAQAVGRLIQPGDQVFLSWRLAELPGQIVRALYRVLRHRLCVGIVDEKDYLRASSYLTQHASVRETGPIICWRQLGVALGGSAVEVSP